MDPSIEDPLTYLVRTDDVDAKAERCQRRRLNNNESAKRSRRKSKERKNMLELETKILRTENTRLRVQVEELTKQLEETTKGKPWYDEIQKVSEMIASSNSLLSEIKGNLDNRQVLSIVSNSSVSFN
jgi:hypothetical protein